MYGIVKGSLQVSGVVYCWNNSKAINCYYLENTVNNGNDSIFNDGISFLSSEEIKKSFNILGKHFKEDIENINYGYPILDWQ